MTSLPASQTCVAFRLGALGDVVLTTGVLDYWKRTRGLSFVFITRPGPAEILAGHPAIERIVTPDESDLKGTAWLRASARLAREFKGMPLIDLHGTLRSRMLSCRWRGPVHRYPKFGLSRRLFHRLRLDVLRRRLERTNVPQRYALALESSPPPAQELLPRILPDRDALLRAEALLGPLDATPRPRPLVALHPYATHPDKAWPREHWLALAALLDAEGLDWFVLGRDREPLFPDLRGETADSRSRDLTNASNLREACALLSRADVLVTNDSGPMHLAAGVGTPVVALFGPTSRAWGFYPAGPCDTILERKMPCRPCTLHGRNRCTGGRGCLRDTAPEQALEAVRDALRKTELRVIDRR
ncbi:glycosyltransferase family 9 protein [Paucidesulfovibrio longus]|uniref:glycosyltransferase family 9 protein n=1 Tax=Paucidesulfovibrio longus TaxID=889 RepID=UPI0003B396C6|nr:glycosyltransferase family 9 protein [Paucidesulfovibrio longus]